MNLSSPTSEGENDGLAKIPDVSDLGQAVENVLNLLGIREFSVKALHDLAESWDLVLFCLGFALGFSFVWVYSIRCFAYVVIWATLVVSNVLMALAATWCFLRYTDLKDESMRTLYPSL